MLKNEGKDYYLYNLLNHLEVPITDEIKQIYQKSSSEQLLHLLQTFNKERLKYLFDKGVLVNEDNIWKMINIQTIDIEVYSHCNWKCEYCPNHLRLKKKEHSIMSMEFYTQIINKVVRYGSTNIVALNGYSEPTIDPFFTQRIKVLKENNLKLSLNTNGSELDKEMTDLLCRMDIVHKLVFNLPSVNREQFQQMTGYKNYDQIIANILYAVSKGKPVTIICQGKNQQQIDNLNEIQIMFSRFSNVTILKGETRDRAGVLKNKYCENTYITGELHGCLRPLNYFSIDVMGNCYICGHDFSRKAVYANMMDGEISKILSSDKAVELRKKIFGEIEAEKNFLCRNCFDMKMTCINHKYMDKVTGAVCAAKEATGEIG